MTCKTWSLPGDHHFQGLCSMEMLMETQLDMSGGCPICVSPVVPDFGLCVSCPVPPPKKYLATIQFDGNGLGTAPDNGCGSDYNRSFVLKNTGNCRWESDELEVNCYTANSSIVSGGLITCSAPASDTRARVSLLLSDATLAGSVRTKWTLQINWQTQSNASRQNHVIAVGHSSVRDCYQSIFAAYYSKVLRFGPFDTWANPMVNQRDGGANVKMNATIAPYGVV